MPSGRKRLHNAESRGVSGHDNFIKLDFVQGEVRETEVTECKHSHLTTLLAGSDCVKRGDPRALFQYVRERYCRPGAATCLKITHAGGFWERLIRWSRCESRVLKAETSVNRIAESDLDSIALIYGFRKFKREYAVGLPIWMPAVLDYCINRCLLRLPLLRRLNHRHISCYIPVEKPELTPIKTATVVIPARNESGNVERLKSATKTILQQLPGSEVIFVEGNSQDSTYADLQSMISCFPSDSVTLLKQDGRGKRDAVKKGFDAGVHEYLAIVDADLTVDLQDSIDAIKIGMSSPMTLINCARIYYPMQKKAMRFFNYIGNRVFAVLLSYVTGQTIGDALCGTKCMSREVYNKLELSGYWASARDPFGDFSILFGVSRYGHEILNYPVRYYARTSGAPNISRWVDGLKLLKMTFKEYVLP